MKYITAEGIWMQGGGIIIAGITFHMGCYKLMVWYKSLLGLN